MAFLPVNLTLWSNAQNPNTPRNLPQWWGYLTTTDNVAAVSGAGYFNIDPNTLLQNTSFRIGDLLYCVCSDSTVELEVTALTPNITTVTNAINVGPNSVNTVAIQNLAVTAAKIALGAITTAQINAAAGILGTQLANGTLTTTQINAAAGILGSQLAAAANINGSQLAAAAGIVGTQLAANTVTSGVVAANLVQYIAVTGITAVAIDAMSVTPILLIPAPAAGFMINLISMTLNPHGQSVTYAGGGAIAAQYGAAASGAPASAAIPAATWNGFTTVSSNVTVVNGNVGTTDVITSGIGVYLSNATGPFTGGTGGIVNAYLTYNIIPVV
jgi:hypothetical protein